MAGTLVIIPTYNEIENLPTYVRGFRYAIENGYEFAFEMDADFSHDPDFLPKFLEEIKTHDLVLDRRSLQDV